MRKFLSLLLLVLAALARAGDPVVVRWIPVDPQVDDSIAGYTVKWGTAPGRYTSTLDVLDATAAEAPIPDANFAAGVAYYFAIFSFTAGGPTDRVESDPSAEITLTFQPADPRLSALTVSAGTLVPNFSAAVTSYTLSVPNTVASVAFTAAATPAGAALDANGTPFAGTSGAMSLQSGVTTNAILSVTHPDKVTIRRYQIAVTRAKSSLAALAGLATDSGQPLVPAFSPTVFSYSVTVSKLVATVVVTATPAPAATAQVNGVSAPAGVPINIRGGSHDVSIAVTAEDGTKKTTTLKIRRKPWEPGRPGFKVTAPSPP